MIIGRHHFIKYIRIVIFRNNLPAIRLVLLAQPIAAQFVCQCVIAIVGNIILIKYIAIIFSYCIDKQTNSQTNKQTSSQTNKQSDKQSADRQTASRQTNKQTVSQSDSQTNSQTDKQTSTQSERQTDSQTAHNIPVKGAVSFLK